MQRLAKGKNGVSRSRDEAQQNRSGRGPPERAVVAAAAAAAQQGASQDGLRGPKGRDSPCSPSPKHQGDGVASQHPCQAGEVRVPVWGPLADPLVQLHLREREAEARALQARPAGLTDLASTSEPRLPWEGGWVSGPVGHIPTGPNGARQPPGGARRGHRGAGAARGMLSPSLGAGWAGARGGLWVDP